jgi:prepilin-type N-terminal cleavage/methylation domain-containing protein
VALNASPRNPQSGLTLVEMLIAVALLGIVLLGIAPLFIASVKSNYTANEYTSIHNLARDRLEQLMNLPITSPQLAVPGSPTVNDLPPTLPDPTTGIPPSNVRNTLHRTYRVTNFVSTPPAVAGDPYTLTAVLPGLPYDFKRIDVTVTAVQDNTLPVGPTLLPSGLGFGSRTARVSGFIRNYDRANILN